MTLKATLESRVNVKYTETLFYGLGLLVWRSPLSLFDRGCSFSLAQYIFAVDYNDSFRSTKYIEVKGHSHIKISALRPVT